LRLYTQPFYLILLAVLLLNMTTTATAGPIRFHVIDAQGRPLKNAVILLPGIPGPTPDTVAVMDQVNKAFVPHVLVIEQGQQVLFPNSDNIRHHVYSFSPAKPFEIKLYAGTPEKPIAFEKPGIVVLGCNIHDTMLGYIIVADTPLVGKTSPQGDLELSPDLPPTEIRVWHPQLTVGSQQLLTLPLPEPDANGQTVIRLTITPPAPTPAGETFGNRLRRNHGQ